MTHKRWLVVAFLLASLGVQYWVHSLRAPSDSKPRIKKGSTAPAFDLQDLDGKTVSLDSLRGQVVIVDFWATWCTPCRTEFELLEKWWDDEQRTGLLDSVVVLAVNTGEDRAVVEQFLASNEIPFRVVLDEDGGVAQAYRVQALPTLMIIDHDGNVADVQVGLDPAIGGSLSMWLKNRDKRERR